MGLFAQAVAEGKADEEFLEAVKPHIGPGAKKRLEIWNASRRLRGLPPQTFTQPLGAKGGH